MAQAGHSLHGRRILITRARGQAASLARLIIAYGGQPIEFPVISFRLPDSAEATAKITAAMNADALARYDWIFFTSTTGVAYFFDWLRVHGIELKHCSSAQIAVVGSKTAAAVERHGFRVMLQAEEYDGEGLLAAIRPFAKPDLNILLPTANLARVVLADGLRELGINVTKLDLYETIPVSEGAEQVIERLKQRSIDVVTFTSSSTVRFFLSALKQHSADGDEPSELLAGVGIACIGKHTAQTAEQQGLKVTVLAKQATIESLIEALAT